MSTTPTPRRRFRDTRLSRFLQARWRLVFATLVCAALIALLPDGFLLVTRFLIGWDAGVALYLVLVTVMVLRSDPGRIRREADLQDEGRLTIPVLTVAAGMASLGAIVFWLRSASESGSTQPLHLELMFLTTLLSWLWSLSTPCSRSTTRTNTTPSIVDRAVACAFLTPTIRTTGISSISPS
ncbi:MAG: DUF1345 domain-containing protein [Methyloceanibacter sp.]